MFGREHSRINGVVRTFDARQIHKARRAADEGAAWEDEFWHRLPAAFGDRPRAKRNPLAALEQRRDLGMRLETLKFVEGGERRICIVQMDDETHGDEAVFEVIEKRTATRAIVERPAERMLDETGRVQ